MSCHEPPCFSHALAAFRAALTVLCLEHLWYVPNQCMVQYSLITAATSFQAASASDGLSNHPGPRALQSGQETCQRAAFTGVVTLGFAPHQGHGAGLVFLGIVFLQLVHGISNSHDGFLLIVPVPRMATRLMNEGAQLPSG